MAKTSPLAGMLDRLFKVGGVRPELSAKISGETEALKLLEQFTDKAALRIMRMALKKSQEPGISAARQAAIAIWDYKNKGIHLADTLTTLIKVYRGNNTLYGMVGFTGGASWLVEHGHRMVKGGTVTRINNLRTDFGRAGKQANGGSGDGTVLSQVPPHPFMAPAMERVDRLTQEIFIHEVERGSQREIKRMAREAGVK